MEYTGHVYIEPLCGFETADVTIVPSNIRKSPENLDPESVNTDSTKQLSESEDNCLCSYRIDFNKTYLFPNILVVFPEAGKEGVLSVAPW